MLSKTQINLKLVPGVDGRAEVCQLVAINLTDIVVKGSWSGPGRLHLVPHVNAPVADFPVRRVIGASSFPRRSHASTDAWFMTTTSRRVIWRKRRSRPSPYKTAGYSDREIGDSRSGWACYSPITSPNSTHALPSNLAIFSWRIGVKLPGSLWMVMPGSSIGRVIFLRLVACLMTLSRVKSQQVAGVGVRLILLHPREEVLKGGIVGPCLVVGVLQIEPGHDADRVLASRWLKHRRRRV